MIGLLVRCYPARWRARYGDEFVALLEERPLGPFEVADVLLGALDAHLHLRGHGAASEHRKGFGMSLYIGGWAAIGGGLLWILALLGESAPLAVVGTAFWIVAIVGLSAFQARREPVMVWTAMAVASVGALATLVGVAGMSGGADGPILIFPSSWDLFNVGAVILAAGSALFGLATLRSRSLSRAGAALLTICAFVSAVALLALVTPVGLALGVTEALVLPLLFGGTIALALGWIALGATVVQPGRLPRRIEGRA
jgi:hypothetical protein